jgi:hypothetical protein
MSVAEMTVEKNDLMINLYFSRFGDKKALDELSVDEMTILLLAN